MRVDLIDYISTPADGVRQAQFAERFGYDGWWAPETTTDACITSAAAAERTSRIRLGTGVAVAFARNPMSVALQANDLQLLSQGRFTLGLGTQVQAHVTRRFSMPWSHPAARMREFVLAIREIWSAWATGEKLDFRGDFYTHTLMTPFFSPGPNAHGNPAIVLAAVGPKMAEVAGEGADGIFCHALTTERYLREVTLPAVRRGAERAGRALDDFEVILPAMICARDEAAEQESGRAFIRRQIGFYGSTPAYRGVLELHGLGGLQGELQALTKRGAWQELEHLVDDETVDTFAIVGTPEQAVSEARRRFDQIVTRLGLTVGGDAEPDRWAAVFEALRTESSGASR